MPIFYSLLGFLLGFGIVVFTIPPLIRVSVAKHLYDTPNERKVSKAIVPTLGGVAIFIGFILSTIIATDGYSFDELKYLIAAVIIMFFIGLKDDLMDISAKKKLLVEIATACILIGLGDFRFTNLQGAFGFHEINYITSFVITLIVMIGLINAFNLIDGIDGLASGISIVISSVFGTWFLLAGHHAYGIMCFSLAGCLIGFFLFNVFGKKNKIFMGDTGSLILGVIMVILVIKFNELNSDQNLPYAINAVPAVTLGILIIPIIDTLRVIFIRLSEKRSPFSPDMNHIHHSFIKLGASHLQSTTYIVLMNILFIAFVFAFNQTLNINVLIISLFTLGFSIAYIPTLILKWKQSPVYSTYEKSVSIKRVNRNDIISKPALSLSDFRQAHNGLLQNRIFAKKEMNEDTTQR
ncbi:MAG TPA: undecaprenyl-phosphate alpha-N-acetylglucosaminyl 1-phosphate transferase [Prolixibacteraceae bacterium]|jgi:UDP-N-acetylmuramyl pentapeptide phosphotransferase/UDP-N-acetylglucosamine-1-phosphate transferase|nr:undecaprenyl-phosphate alpha-N-acetylglucosaminyl 1-phosphate transferase [Prolixibacteraceae bacterium]